MYVFHSRPVAVACSPSVQSLQDHPHGINRGEIFGLECVSEYIILQKMLYIAAHIFDDKFP